MALDLLIVPGGEDIHRSRSNTVMNRFFKEKNNDLRILLTGEGLGTKIPEITEAQEMKNYLQDSIPDEKLIISPHGRDFYSGLVLASDVINNLRYSGNKIEEIGLVNDDFAMNRYLQLASFVMGDKFSFELIKTGNKGTLTDKLKETILKNSLFYDVKNVWGNTPARGDLEMHKKAVFEDHPMYANPDRKTGLYDLIVKSHKALNS